jgi:hypothetical protein
LIVDNCYKYNNKDRNPHLLPDADRLKAYFEQWLEDNRKKLDEFEREMKEKKDVKPALAMKKGQHKIKLSMSSSASNDNLGRSNSMQNMSMSPIAMETDGNSSPPAHSLSPITADSPPNLFSSDIGQSPVQTPTSTRNFAIFATPIPLAPSFTPLLTKNFSSKKQEHDEGDVDIL